MILLKLTDRYLNLDHMVDAQIRREKDGMPAVTLAFAAPQSDSVGASDWVTDAYSITLRGIDAITLLSRLDGILDDAETIESAYGPILDRKPTIAPWPDNPPRFAPKSPQEAVDDDEEGGPA